MLSLMVDLLFRFLVFRQPPASPLFPYTTLFRSHGGEDGGCPGRVGRVGCPRHRGAGRGSGGAGWDDEQVDLVADRKSTRLNSSHMSISYAVFCLKKKIAALALLGSATPDMSLVD